MTSPCVLCAAHHLAASQEHVDLLLRRRRCRLRRRDASKLLALLRVRRRPVPHADRARLSRAPVTTVTSPCVLLRAQRRPSPRLSPVSRRPSSPAPPLPPAPSWRVDAARLVASSAPARAARRVSAPLALPRHHRDLTLRAQRCPSPRRSPRARRPAAPTSPWLTAPSWRVDAAHLVAISAPARATCRVSAPLARPRRPRDLTLRALCCSSTPRRPRARRPAAPTSPLPPAPSWHVGAARLVASSAPARAARRLSAPLARPRHRRDITLRARALPDAYPCATVQARVDRPRRRLVAARAVVARLQVSLRLAPRSERARCLRASATTVTSPPSRALCAVPHRATPQARVDRPRRRRLRRPRRRSALTIFPLSRARRRLTPRAERARRLRASANPVAPIRCSTSPRRPSPRPSPQACQPSALTPPFPSAPSHRVVARRLYPLSFNRGAGSRRAPREPVVLAPSSQHHPVACPHFDAHLLEPCPRSCRPATPNSSSPRPPPERAGARRTGRLARDRGVAALPLRPVLHDDGLTSTFTTPPPDSPPPTRRRRRSRRPPPTCARASYGRHRASSAASGA